MVFDVNYRHLTSVQLIQGSVRWSLSCVINFVSDARCR